MNIKSLKTQLIRTRELRHININIKVHLFRILISKTMSGCDKDVVLDINVLNIELRKKLEMVSKWRGK